MHGAEGRIERAEDELRRYRADRARDLLAELKPDARQAVERWMAWAAEGHALHRELVEIANRSTVLVVGTRIYGGDGRQVPGYDHQAHVLKLAGQEPPLPLPRPFVAELEAEETGDE